MDDATLHFRLTSTMSMLVIFIASTYSLNLLAESFPTELRVLVNCVSGVIGFIPDKITLFCDRVLRATFPNVHYRKYNKSSHNIIYIGIASVCRIYAISISCYVLLLFVGFVAAYLSWSNLCKHPEFMESCSENTRLYMYFTIQMVSQMTMSAVLYEKAALLISLTFSVYVIRREFYIYTKTRAEAIIAALIAILGWSMINFMFRLIIDYAGHQNLIFYDVQDPFSEYPVLRFNPGIVSPFYVDNPIVLCALLISLLVVSSVTNRKIVEWKVARFSSNLDATMKEKLAGFLTEYRRQNDEIV